MKIFEDIIKELSQKNDDILQKSVQQMADDLRETAVNYLFGKLGRLPTYEEYASFVDKGKMVHKQENGKITASYQWDLTQD